MTDLLSLHKYFLSSHLKKGGVAVDFTMGNGHDTEYLCRSVYGGESMPAIFMLSTCSVRHWNLQKSF